MTSIVTISCLGEMGGWGNQLFQYAFARAYARKHGARLVTPQWEGSSRFSLPSFLEIPTLPTMEEHNWEDGRVNVDLRGYFQSPEFLVEYTEEDARRWFPIPEGPGPYGAVHVRRGDYSEQLYPLVSWRSIGEAAHRIEESCHLPVKIVQSDDGRTSWWDDFLTLCHADILYRANSTFSWWAGILGHHREVWSPRWSCGWGIQDVVWMPNNDEPNYSQSCIEGSMPQPNLYLGPRKWMETIIR